MMNHPEIKSQDFTTKKNDDTIKVSDNTTIKNSLTEGASKLSSSFEAPKSYPYKEQKPKDSFTLNKEYKTGDIFKIPKFKSTIPNEKLERKRLERLTGAYDLNSVSSEVIEQNKRLKKKTDPNYYRDDKNLSLKEVNQRLDEAFGPKTDFSIHNFENNYDKLNLDEQEMFTRKMQTHFNNEGYTDYEGFKLQPDGELGPRTRSVYKAYIKQNKADYDEAIADKKAYEDYESIVTGDKALKEAELMLKNTNAKPKFSEYTPADIKVNSETETKSSSTEPKTYEVAKTSYTTSNSNTSKANESEIASQSRIGRNASPVSSRSLDRNSRSRANNVATISTETNNKANDVNLKGIDTIYPFDKNYFKNEIEETMKKSITTEIKYEPVNEEFINPNARYTTSLMIYRLQDTKHKYLDAQKRGDKREMYYLSEVGKYLKSMLRLSTEYRDSSSGFAKLVEDAINYDNTHINPQQSIENWGYIFNYASYLSSNIKWQYDYLNGHRGITYELIDSDINLIKDLCNKSPDMNAEISLANNSTLGSMTQNSIYYSNKNGGTSYASGVPATYVPTQDSY